MCRAKDYETTSHSTKQNIQSKTKFRYNLQSYSISAMILCFRFQKLLRDMSKLLETNTSNIWSPADVQHLDRSLGELKRSFASQVSTALCSSMYCNEIMLFGL